MVHKRDDHYLVDGEEFDNFAEFVNSEHTLYGYKNALLIFLSTAKIDINEFLKIAKEDAERCNNILWGFVLEQKQRVKNNEIQAGTLRNYLKGIKLLLDVNDIETVKWLNLRKILPPNRRFGQDRTPTLEEIRKVYNIGDLRLKCFISMTVSSGVRAGAWEFLDVKHITPIQEGDKVVAAKMNVYAGEPDEYLTFISPEAYQDYKNYLEYREKHGEKIFDDTPIIRNHFGKRGSTVEVKVENVKRLAMQGLYAMITHAYWSAGMRLEKKKRHEFKAEHGFRKYFKTQCEQVMKPINVETLLGHSTGIRDNDYRPTEKILLEDYLKVIPFLTISEVEEVKRNFETELKEEK